MGRGPIIVLSLVLASFTTVVASEVTFDFTGHVILSKLGDVAPGARIVGALTFDTTVPDSLPLDPLHAEYHGTGTIEFRIAGLPAVNANVPNSTRVSDRCCLPGFADVFAVSAGVGLAKVAIDFRDGSDGTAITGDALPSSPPDMNAFSMRRFLYDQGRFHTVFGEIDTLAPRSVPEPSTLGLLVAGVLLIGGLLTNRGGRRW